MRTYKDSTSDVFIVDASIKKVGAMLLPPVSQYINIVQ